MARCRHSRSGAPIARPSDSRSMTCPPMRPVVPQASPRSAVARTPPADARGVPALGDLGHEVEGAGQERVAGEDRDRLAEHLVRGGLAAPQVVVVHGRQVVVDEAVGVDHLHRAGERHQVLARPAHRLAGREDEHGTDALAAGEEAVAHGAVDGGRPGRLRRERPVERLVHRDTESLHRRRGVEAPGRGGHRPSSSPAGTMGVVRRPALRVEHGLAPRVLQEHLDPALGLLELPVAEPGQADAVLVEPQGLLEGQLAFLQPLHDALELLQGLLERGLVGLLHSVSLDRTEARMAPRWSRMRRPWPSSTSAASRTSPWPASSQTSA